MKHLLLGILLGSLSVIAMDSYSMDYIEIEKLRIMEEIETELFIMNNRAQDNYYVPSRTVDWKKVEKNICKEIADKKKQGILVYTPKFCEM